MGKMLKKTHTFIILFINSLKQSQDGLVRVVMQKAGNSKLLQIFKHILSNKKYWRDILSQARQPNNRKVGNA